MPTLRRASPRGSGPDAWRLFLLGFVGLFLELALIRYLPARIWYLGYFPNFVLLAAFLGMGLGFVGSRALPGDFSDRAGALVPFLLLAVVSAGYFLKPVVPGIGGDRSEVGGELFFTVGLRDDSLAAYALFAALFLAIALAFAGITQRTARYFGLFPPLRAYSLDILGSVAGILAFMAISAWGFPAWSWFVAVALLLLAGCPRLDGRPHRFTLPVMALAVLLVFLPGSRRSANLPPGAVFEMSWSPYQMVTFLDLRDGAPAVFVNRIPHQNMLDGEHLENSFYLQPHRLRAASGRPPFRRVLVIGAGTGNDVAAALRSGAERVDAVEIDPVIARLGREKSVLGTYRDPRVRLIVDDGRSVLTRAREPYDLIVFALTDSLVRAGSLSQLRLENFLFTRESFERAYRLLSPEGEILLYNFYRQKWFAERILETLAVSTGRIPRVILQDGDFYQIAVGPRDAPAPNSARRFGQLPTDDWPFPYLRERGVPAFYRGLIGGLVFLLFVGALILLRAEKGRRPAGTWAWRAGFFAMGAAFLLLETKSVVQFSLLYGTTWWNSSVVFLAILLLVLLANRLAAAAPPGWGRRAIPALLLASCVLALLVPLSRFLYVENAALRLAGASWFALLPVFFANLYFSVMFRGRPAAADLFGWNLLGAAAGGVLEYSSMAVGYNALSVGVAILYGAALLSFWVAGAYREERSRREGRFS